MIRSTGFRDKGEFHGTYSRIDRLQNSAEYCTSWEELLSNRQLIIASNHGPVTFHTDENGILQPQRSGGGGLVTALSGIAQHVECVLDRQRTL